jgi:lysophospholipase L1-like esterase
MNNGLLVPSSAVNSPPVTTLPRHLWILPLVLFSLGCHTVGTNSASPSNTTEPLPQTAARATYLADLKTELTKSWPANRTVNIACHGHSVPAGYFKTPAVHTFEAYPTLLHRALTERYPHAVINVIVTAIGGENSESGAARFDHDVLALHPDLITIDYALNDRAIGLARAETAWRKMITEARSHGIKVILLTPTPDTSAHLNDPTEPLNQHAQQIRRLAQEYNVASSDSLQAFETETKSGTPLASLMAQSNHPNARGHQLVTNELLKWF